MRQIKIYISVAKIKMKKQENIFEVNVSKDAVVAIKNSTIMQPKIAFNGGFTKWFDDSQLIKKPQKN